MSEHALVARLDNAGDVLLCGPAVRAVAARSGRLTFLAGPGGAAAARLLPGVDAVEVFDAPWVSYEPAPVDRRQVLSLVHRIGALSVDRAIIFTSFHQSPLPLALLLRLAGVPFIAAISPDYPGALLDRRHAVDDDVHEVERALSLALAAGYALPVGDDAELRVRQTSPPPAGLPAPGFVAVHPGASVPARAWSPARHRALVDALVRAGRDVVVTGAPGERDLTRLVAGPARPGVVDIGGRTSLAELAAVLAGAGVLVTGNTGPAHLAAAVGTPVVSLFAPTVPAVRWRPWRVPQVLLGDQQIACAGCRARVCPMEGHPCIETVEPADVLAAAELLAPASEARGGRTGTGARLRPSAEPLGSSPRLLPLLQAGIPS